MIDEIIRWDNFPSFPIRRQVQLGTYACLTSRFGMRLGEPGSYGRPRLKIYDNDL